MSDTVKVEVSTWEEAYPVLIIGEPDDPDDQYNYPMYDVPRCLMDALTAARGQVSAAELAIMKHIEAEHPDAAEVRDWLTTHTE